jgi:hypothetical protein
MNFGFFILPAPDERFLCGRHLVDRPEYPRVYLIAKVSVPPYHLDEHELRRAAILFTAQIAEKLVTCSHSVLARSGVAIDQASPPARPALHLIAKREDAVAQPVLRAFRRAYMPISVAVGHLILSLIVAPSLSWTP